MNKYISEYLTQFTLLVNQIDIKKILLLSSYFKEIKKKNSKIIIVGNGGSASIANHVTTDLSKVCRIRAINFNEGNFLTCLSNDYSYENWVVEALKIHAEKKDLIVLISSGGNSPNIINAAKYCRKNNYKLVTLNGFDNKNPILKKYGILNFSINSINYNHIENIHQLILLTSLDYLLNSKI